MLLELAPTTFVACCHGCGGVGSVGLDVCGGKVRTALPLHLSPNVSTSVTIFGPAEVRHTTMGTLSGL